MRATARGTREAVQQDAFLAGTANVEGDSPLLSDLLADRTAFPPFASRMP